MLGVACSGLVLIGILLCSRLHRFMIAISRVAVNHDGKGVLPVTHLSGTMGEVRRYVGLIKGLMLILLLFLGRMGF